MDCPYRLDWFINSQCDWTCSRCLSPATPSRPDLGLADRRAALDSFMSLAQQAGRQATIAFYPRQATFTDAFVEILRATQEFRKNGPLRRVTTVNRGDLTADKIALFAQFGVDGCRVTVDGPEPVQNALRRPGSFRDTLESFRGLRQAGIRVTPMMLIVRFNAPHVAETMKLMLAEGFSEFALQVGIRAESDRAKTDPKAGHGNPLWNEQLSANEYRSVLLASLDLVDSLDDSLTEYRTRFILGNAMFARLFHELGRMDEYRRLMQAHPELLPTATGLRFALQPAGEVSVGPDAGVKLGSFPGGSFGQMFQALPSRAMIETDSCLTTSLSQSDPRFVKCRDCPAASCCPPKLVGASPVGLTFQPDEHCWVSSGKPGATD